MSINIKFTKFDNTPWGFRLAGGGDFPQPLTVIRVTDGSLAECMGLKTGDVIVKLNDEPISELSHGQAHDALLHAGNNFVLEVRREEEARLAAKALTEENIIPYKISLAELSPLYPEDILKEDVITIECCEKKEEEIIEEGAIIEDNENKQEEEELYQEKPVDSDSVIVSNKNLTDDEIAQLILEEEELLSDQGLLGVNFKKLRPRAPILKGSKVLEELQHDATAEPERVQELKRVSTFLQKPQRPVPKSKSEEKNEEPEGETYKVVIKKQDKKTVIARLVQKGLLPSSTVVTSQQSFETITSNETLAEPIFRSDEETRSDSHHTVRTVEVITGEENEVNEDRIEDKSVHELDEKDYRPESSATKSSQDDTVTENESSISEKRTTDLTTNDNKDKIKELVSTEIDLEQQLENVQRQLVALKQLPREIENHLKIVSEQLRKIMELSGVQLRGNGTGNRGNSSEEDNLLEEMNEEESRGQEEETEDEEFTETYDYIEEIACLERRKAPVNSTPQMIEPSDDEGEMEEEEAEIKELDGMISVKSMDEEGNRVKRFIVSYETKVIKSPSPTMSHGSFEPDPNLSPKDQVIQELQQKIHKKGKKPSQDLWPQAKQLELTRGRRWRCPNDFFNDEMIAEVLSCQAEVIRGKTMGVNFKKYEKTNLPNFDHLMNSSVYKMIHKMEKEPKKGIPARPAKVNAAEDIIERIKSPVLSVTSD